MKRTSSFALIVIVLLATSCKKDPEGEPPVELPNPSERVLISCEGGFGNNNGSLSSYDTGSMEAASNVFEAINGYGLGDVMQSLSGQGQNLYLVVNNSAKVEVADKETLVAGEAITGLVSPRVIQVVNEDKAYVSNLYTNDVQVVDLDSRLVTASVDVGGWSEGMVLVGDEVFVARNSGSKLMVIDSTTDLVVDSVEVGEGPVDIVEDSSGNLWVISLGFDANFNIDDAHLTKINPISREVLGTYMVPQPWSYKMALRGDATGENLLVLNNVIYRMNSAESSLSTIPFVDNDHANYSIGVDPSNGDIYLGRVTDFSSAGVVNRYTASGESIDDFEVGIAPNGFYFGQ